MGQHRGGSGVSSGSQGSAPCGGSGVSSGSQGSAVKGQQSRVGSLWGLMGHQRQ